jgi:hypothetical protein
MLTSSFNMPQKCDDEQKIFCCIYNEVMLEGMYRSFGKN